MIWAHGLALAQKTCAARSVVAHHNANKVFKRAAYAYAYASLLVSDQVCFDTEADLAVTLSAVMYVRNIDDLCILQFTPTLASGRVLHRPASRVVHRRKCSLAPSRFGNLPRGAARAGLSLVVTESSKYFSSGPKPLSFVLRSFVSMILPQVHLRKPCYDFYFL